MAPEVDVAELVSRHADERLLGEDLDKLPSALGRPAETRASPARKRVVAIGVTLTGVTLVLGVALTAFGAVDGFASGFDGISLVALVVGIVLITTHWGWAHVAELTGQHLERQANREVLDGRQRWLAAIEPYPRWEVTASTGDDGSIAIATTRYTPVRTGEDQFSFTKDEVGREHHAADEPAAIVTERAELLRRQAAQDTARERERYEAAHDAYERAVLDNADEQERLAAARAASEALSEQINTNLREPPLVE